MKTLTIAEVNAMAKRAFQRSDVTMDSYARDAVYERVDAKTYRARIKEYTDMGYSAAEAEKRVKMDGTHLVKPGQLPGPTKSGME